MALAMPTRAEISVHPAANHDTSWRDNSTGRTDDWRSHHGSPAAGGDAASTNHAASADDSTCFHGAQGDEASCQQ